MENVLIRKLERFAPLPIEDKRLLGDVLTSGRMVAARMDLIREGEASKDVRLILDGFACRYKLLNNGKRQIVAYLLPGDFCDLHIAILKAMDHNIGTLSPCTVVDIPRGRILEMIERAAIMRAFWWVNLVDEAILREWLLNVGQRTAAKRTAHLLCELIVRLEAVDLAHGETFKLPLTQAEIGDTLGFTFVHVNRCLQQLRDMGFVTRTGFNIVASRLPGMIKFCGFDPNYLHLESSSHVG